MVWLVVRIVAPRCTFGSSVYIRVGLAVTAIDQTRCATESKPPDRVTLCEQNVSLVYINMFCLRKRLDYAFRGRHAVQGLEELSALPDKVASFNGELPEGSCRSGLMEGLLAHLFFPVLFFSSTQVRRVQSWKCGRASDVACAV